MPSEKLKSDCIFFTGLKDNQGYGVVSIGDERIKAHRLAYKLAHPRQTLTKNICVCHHCDNPSCINPKHLFVGKNGDNNKDRSSKGRNAVGVNHGRAKLTEKDVLKIREMHGKGYTTYKLAKIFKVSQALISYITIRKYWKHI